MNDRNSRAPFIIGIVVLVLVMIGIFIFAVFAVFDFGDRISGNTVGNTSQRVLVSDASDIQAQNDAYANQYGYGGGYGAQQYGGTYPAGDIRNTDSVSDPRITQQSPYTSQTQPTSSLY